MTAGGLVPSQTYKDLAARADNTAVRPFFMANGKTEKKTTKMWKFCGQKQRVEKLQMTLYGMESMDQPGKVASPARGQVNRES